MFKFSLLVSAIRCIKGKIKFSISQYQSCICDEKIIRSVILKAEIRFPELMRNFTVFRRARTSAHVYKGQTSRTAGVPCTRILQL